MLTCRIRIFASWCRTGNQEDGSPQLVVGSDDLKDVEAKLVKSHGLRQNSLPCLLVLAALLAHLHCSL